MEHHQTVDIHARALQVVRGLFWCPLQILILKTNQILIFLISPNFINPLRKTISSQQSPKITQKFTNKSPQNIVLWSREFLDCLKRERDIRIKPKLTSVKTAFRCTPALNAECTYYRRDKWLNVNVNCDPD